MYINAMCIIKNKGSLDKVALLEEKNFNLNFVKRRPKQDIGKKKKKKRYYVIRQFKKLKRRYDLNKQRSLHVTKAFRSLKRQKSFSSKLINSLELRISRLLKGKHQSRKLSLYLIILKRLIAYRKKVIICISRKRGLYAYYKKKKEAEKKKFYRSKKKKPKIKPSYGVLKVLTIKRNIFISLTDLKGNVRATVSSGLLKVKGKKRQATYIVKATGQKIINLIFKHRILKLFVTFRGRTFRKKKRTLTQIFSKVKKFEFLKVNRPARRCHNGCRSPKKRRK